jgi:DNA-binding PadR family transcriptional regulator
MSESRDATRSETSSIRSPLAWALLGLVIEQPSYGYELVQRYRRVYGETPALTNVSNVYRLLDTLGTRELIEQTAPGPAEKPARNRLPKPHYRATEQGVHAYAEWLLVQLAEERQRQRLFARQLAMLEPHAALELMDRFEEECLIEADEATPPQTEQELVAGRLADRDEELSLGARLSWIRFAREELVELRGDQPKGRGRG